VAALQLAGALVSVWELADPATLEMGDTAPTGNGCVEVDVAVVQVQALSGNVPDLHFVPPISDPYGLCVVVFNCLA